MKKSRKAKNEGQNCDIPAFGLPAKKFVGILGHFVGKGDAFK